MTTATTPSEPLGLLVDAQLRTARLLRSMPLVADAVLTGTLTPQQAAVLTRLVGKIEQQALLESQPQLIAAAATMDPAQLGMWVSHQIATHCEPALDADDAKARDKRYLTCRREADGSLYGRFASAARTAKPSSPPLNRWPVEPVTRTGAPPGNAGPTPSSSCPSRSCATASCRPPAAGG